MDVDDGDIHVELAGRAFIVGHPHADGVAVLLLVIEQQAVRDGDVAVDVHVEAAAGIVEQGVGERAAVRILADQRADRGAVTGILGRGSVPVTPVGASLTLITFWLSVTVPVL